MIYAGFWRRTLSLVGDMVVLTPVFALHLTLGYSSRPALAISTIMVGVVSVAFPVFFLSKWGQTPGKMLARIKVTQVDGSPIGAARAWRRSMVDIGLSAAWVIGILYALATWRSAEWSSLDRSALLKALQEGNPLYGLNEVGGQIWYWGELVVLLMNKKRRSLHDFIAGTVVIRHTPRASHAGEARVGRTGVELRGAEEENRATFDPAGRLLAPREDSSWAVRKEFQQCARQPCFSSRSAG